MNLTSAVDPRPDFTSLIEARELWDVHKHKLTEKQRTTIEAWLAGQSASDIAAAEQVHVRKIHERIARGLQRLRELVGAAAA